MSHRLNKTAVNIYYYRNIWMIELTCSNRSYRAQRKSEKVYSGVEHDKYWISRMLTSTIK